MRTLTLLVAIYLTGSGVAASQCVPKKRDTVTLKIPASAFGKGKTSKWNLKTTRRVAITLQNDSVVVNGDPNWQKSGWPLMLTFELQKLSIGKAKTEVEVKVPKAYPERVFALDLNVDEAKAPRTIDAVIFCGSADQFEKSSGYASDIAELFAPELSKKLSTPKLSGGQVAALAKIADYDLEAISVTEYKSHRYIAVAQESAKEYNSIQLGQAARAARVIQDELLADLKTGFHALKDVAGVDGLRLDMDISYRDFVREPLPNHDALTIYVSFGDLGKFVESDITAQALLDSSVILINENRMQINLGTTK